MKENCLKIKESSVQIFTLSFIYLSRFSDSNPFKANLDLNEG